jgi:hypothetical protein
MLHACSYTICLVFCYTSWRFYAFSGTNLLTRPHSASSLFSAIFVFQKSYTGNILGIGRNKSRTSQYLTKLPEDQRGDREGPRAGHTIGRRCGDPGLPPRDSRYAYNSRSQETVVNPHNRVGIADYIIHYITSIKVLYKPLG